MSETTIESINIKITDEVQAELTVEDARALMRQLMALFGETQRPAPAIPVPYPVPSPYPVPVWPHRRPYWRDGTWCTSLDTSSGSVTISTERQPRIIG